MSDREFSELQLRVQICPRNVSGRSPRSHFRSWATNRPLRACTGNACMAANEARARVNKAYVQMDEIDRNNDLSRDGKYRQRNKIRLKRLRTSRHQER